MSYENKTTILQEINFTTIGNFYFKKVRSFLFNILNALIRPIEVRDGHGR